MVLPFSPERHPRKKRSVSVRGGRRAEMTRTAVYLQEDPARPTQAPEHPSGKVWRLLQSIRLREAAPKLMCDPLPIRQEMGVTSVVQRRKASGAQQEIYETETASPRKHNMFILKNK